MAIDKKGANSLVNKNLQRNKLILTKHVQLPLSYIGSTPPNRWYLGNAVLPYRRLARSGFVGQ